MLGGLIADAGRSEESCKEDGEIDDEDESGGGAHAQHLHTASSALQQNALTWSVQWVIVIFRFLWMFALRIGRYSMLLHLINIRTLQGYGRDVITDYV